MSRTRGRSALAVSLPRRQETPRPAWLSGLLEELVISGRVSAAAALVGDGRGEVAAGVVGEADAQRGRPLFDLASLSKLWTASLALRLDARGLLPLGLEIGELWSGCDRRLARRTLEDLLRHRAGFVPWTPLYRRCRRRSTAIRLLVEGSLLGARRGTYSDLDYMLWGLSAERALGRPFSELLREQLTVPLGLDHGRPPAAGTFWVPCHLGNEREIELAAAQGIRIGFRDPPAAGLAQDGNTRLLGAPAGHAGLFATSRALLALAREWLAPGALWPASAVDAALAGPGRLALGWRRATRRGSAGPALGEGAYGHVGFTGGSVWVDPGRERIFVLLAHRAGVDVDLAATRRRFHALALGSVGGSTVSPSGGSSRGRTSSFEEGSQP